jgi:hypothetical protein
MLPELIRGDVVLFHSSSKIGGLVREGQRIPGKQKYAAAANHGAIVTEPGPIRSARSVEATFDGSQERGLFEHHALDMWWVYRCNVLTRGVREALAVEARRRCNEPYPFLDLATAWIDRKAFGGRTVFGWATRWLWGSTCTQLVAEVYHKFGLGFGGKPWAATPDGIMRHVLAHPRQWSQVWSGFPYQYVEEEERAG